MTEKSYTRIFDYILERNSKNEKLPRTMRLYEYFRRHITGFNQRKREFKISKISNGTGIPSNDIKKVLNRLEFVGLIKVRKSAQKVTYEIVSNNMKHPVMTLHWRQADRLPSRDDYQQAVQGFVPIVEHSQ